MPRTARVVVPGYLYHVTQRGNYRQNVFEADQDRITYLKYIQERSRECGVSIYAFCLMDNHVHLIVKPKVQESLGRFFSVSHMKYAHYFHKKKKQRGHLWQGRFYSCLLCGDHIIDDSSSNHQFFKRRIIEILSFLNVFGKKSSVKKRYAMLNVIRFGQEWSNRQGTTVGHQRERI